MDDVLKDQYFRLDVLKYEYRIAKFYNSLIYRILIQSFFPFYSVLHKSIFQEDQK